MALSSFSRRLIRPVYETFINSTRYSFNSNRSITMSRSKLEKVVQELQKNPYYETYSEKIAKLQNTSPDEFLQRVEAKEKELRDKREFKERKFREITAKPNLESGAQSPNVQLDKIMKLDLILDKTPEEIKQIWHEYHKEKDCIVGVMSREQFEKIFERGRKYNTFLLPLPKENGYEFIMSQFHGTEIHMTPLIWYQAHKENAPECLTMTHYTELKDSKGIVLMRGEFDVKSLNVQEAQCLANEIQLYYSTNDENRLKLLQTFMEKPDEFKHMDLIKQMETISLEHGEHNFQKSKPI